MPSLTLRLSFELAFGDGSPYSEMFPSLYGLPYPVNQAITQEVMDKVMDKVVEAVAEATGVEQVDTIYGVGGFKAYPVTPSGQITLRGEREAIYDFMDAVGYLAQQTEIIAQRPILSGETRFLRIVESDGQKMADPQFVQRFWSELLAESPKMAQGFQPVLAAGQHGILIVNSDEPWDPAEDYPEFVRAIKRVELTLGIRVKYEQGRAECFKSGNDWSRDGTGRGYLDSLNSRGRSDLQRRLDGQLRPQTEQWIAEAFERHAPEEFRRLRERGAEWDAALPDGVA